MNLKKLDIFIIKKFLGTFIFAIILIVSIAVVFDFAEKIDDYLENNAPFKAIIFEYYLNFIPYFANLFSYLFTFIAVIFFTSRMSVRSEIVAIYGSGVSLKRLLIPYFIVATIIAAFTFLLSSFVIPPTSLKRNKFEQRYYYGTIHYSERNIHKQLAPDVIIYMQSYNSQTNTGYKFSIEKYEIKQNDNGTKNRRLKSKLISDYIRWDTTNNKWIIHNYFIREIDGMHEKVEQGAQTDTSLNLHPSDFSRHFLSPETMDYHELNEHIALLEARGTENIEHYYIEKYKRFAAPFSVYILTLIGVSLAVHKTKEGMGIQIGIGFLLSFTHILFMQISSQFAVSGDIHPLIAVWIPNLFFLGLALILYRMAPK